MADLPNLILATGALGTASFGIVEGFIKPWSFLGVCPGAWGYGSLKKTMGRLWDTLKVAYGTEAEAMLLTMYRGQRSEVESALRKAVRIGLTSKNAASIAKELAVVDPDELTEVAAILEKGEKPEDEQRLVIGRFELAADARIDAAVRLASTYYVGGQQVAAAIVSIILAFVTDCAVLGGDHTKDALLVGVAAVPLAPVAKDVASTIQSLAKTFKAKS